MPSKIETMLISGVPFVYVTTGDKSTAFKSGSDDAAAVQIGMLHDLLVERDKRIAAFERALTPSTETLAALGTFIQYEWGEQMPIGIQEKTVREIMTAISKQASKPEEGGDDAKPS